MSAAAHPPDRTTAKRKVGGPKLGNALLTGFTYLLAFVFVFPLLQTSMGLRGTLLLTAGVSVLGLALTLVLPEPAGRSLDDITRSLRDTAAPARAMAEQASAP